MVAEGKTRAILVLGAIFAVAGLVAESSLASSGEFTRAQVSNDGAHASIAGTVEWTVGCEEWPDLPEAPPPPPPSTCSVWAPYATIGPLSSDCSSPDRTLPGVGDEVQVLWKGGANEGIGSASFDLPEVSLPDEEGPFLLCLSAAETRTVFSCGWLGGWDCHVNLSTYDRKLDSALLELPTPKAPPDTAPSDGQSPLNPPSPGELSATGASGSSERPRKRCRRRAGQRARRAIEPNARAGKQRRKRCRHRAVATLRDGR